MLQYTSGPVGIKKQDWGEKKKNPKPKSKVFQYFASDKTQK